MKKSILKLLKTNKLKFIFIALIFPILVSWGALGHEHINRAAVLSIPTPLQSFFYNHIDFMTQEASVPDLRKYTLGDKAEDPRHYIDLENFGSLDSLPATLAELNKKYSEEFLRQNGILPWYLEEMMAKLTKAFKDKRKTEILFLAADMAHYLGDANTPLHATVNYDGQLSNQKGIHSLWETQMFKMFAETYNYNAGEAVYINDIRKEIWRMVNNSHALADTLLRVDKELRQKVSTDFIFVKDTSQNGNKSKYQAYSPAYAQKLHEHLNGMIESQMRSSIKAAASFWYTAWVNAGKPDLSDLDPESQTARNKPALKKELKLFRQGKLMDIKVGK